MPILTSAANLLAKLCLNLLKREYEEDYVRVIVLEDIGKIFVPEGVVELTRGTEYSLPRWIAQELVDKGVVELKEGEIGLERLAKIAYNEESTMRKPVFVKLYPYFYHLIIDEVRKLYERLEAEKTPLILSDVQKYENYISTIGKIRVRKLINLLLVEPPEDMFTKLSEEEKILYIMLKNILAYWLKSLRIEKG
ncbi:MAG: DNA replication complex GINS family protein [Desulfurococcales archaeon]|nr:DNA replication complex GINS family protein [Desulfurococcales archaeon]